MLGLLLVLLGLLVAVDDWINNALGWPTPFDQFWSPWLRGAIK